MKTKTVKISEIKPHPKNPKQHPHEQLIELKDSLNKFEQVKNIVIWKGYIIAGHGIVAAAEQAEITNLSAVDVSEWDEEKAIKYMIADNRLPELGVINNDILAGLLNGFDIPGEVPGISESFIDELFEDSEINFDKEKDEEKKLKLQNGNTVKMAIFTKDITLIEKSLAKTGEINRGLALKKICEAYLEKR